MWSSNLWSISVNPSASTRALALGSIEMGIVEVAMGSPGNGARSTLPHGREGSRPGNCLMRLDAHDPTHDLAQAALVQPFHRLLDVQPGSLPQAAFGPVGG